MARIPGRMARIPGCMIRIPGRMIRIPGRMARIPGRLIRIPGRMIRIPGRLIRIPGRIVGTCFNRIHLSSVVLSVSEEHFSSGRYLLFLRDAFCGSFIYLKNTDYSIYVVRIICSSM